MVAPVHTVIVCNVLVHRCQTYQIIRSPVPPPCRSSRWASRRSLPHQVVGKRALLALSLWHLWRGPTTPDTAAKIATADRTDAVVQRLVFLVFEYEDSHNCHFSDFPGQPHGVKSFHGGIQIPRPLCDNAVMPCGHNVHGQDHLATIWADELGSHTIQKVINSPFFHAHEQ
eukprot:1815949-Amphidinium_carterae.1